MTTTREYQAMELNDLEGEVDSLRKQRDDILEELHKANDVLKAKQAEQSAMEKLTAMSPQEREAMAHIISPKGIPKASQLGTLGSRQD